MSTRANIILQSGTMKKYLYRHCDGYPEITLASLQRFLRQVEAKEIENISEVEEYLIDFGRREYEKSGLHNCYGAYEPTTGLHGDIEYLYIIDLNEKSIEVKKI